MNKKIIEYKIISPDYTGSTKFMWDILSDEVNVHISQGWQPLGGQWDYMQVMVKYEQESINSNAKLSTPNQEGDEA